ncbi:hypothetical protein AVENLUH5627_00486 [Acinetobacter venetianus]|uniref:Uncharacterized protein n=1 Tax=Acinetobacter venetianus TaxID=52133 RepID=A0A150I1Z1_9GAMM|nr:hypothetical protein [Acinetobacter venetianus]KXZ73651.1 hypothetical protein AVENLUH5627_00486 [Acinetobacter venetianus]
MLKNLISLCWGICASFSLYAQETKITGFDQFFNLDVEHHYELELKNLNPSAQIWTAFYIVGVPKSAGMQTKADFTVIGEGLLSQAHPTNPTEVMSLMANDLPIRQNYSLKAFDDLASEIESQTGVNIQDPDVNGAANVRVYGRILDWIPEYNLQKPAVISFGITDAQDFDIKAAYVIVGEGEKTPQLMQLNIQEKADPEQVQQAFKETTKSSEFRLARFETKFLIFFVILAATIFLNWHRFRRG